jgi:hypothetical protein
LAANDQRHIQDSSWTAPAFGLGGGSHFGAEYT